MGVESIRVVCGSCKRGIKAPAKYAGRSAKCPGCGKDIHIPKAPIIAAPPIKKAPPIQQETKSCPYCDEQIKLAAKKCRHCGELLDEAMRRKAERASGPNAGLAMILSLLIPGAGQLYKGQFISGVFWFLAVVTGYLALIIPGLVLHLFCILGAGYEGVSRK